MLPWLTKPKRRHQIIFQMPEADTTHKDKQSGSRPVNEPSKWRRIGKLIDVSDDMDGKALEVTI